MLFLNSLHTYIFLPFIFAIFIPFIYKLYKMKKYILVGYYLTDTSCYLYLFFFIKSLTYPKEMFFHLPFRGFLPLI